MGYRNMRIFLLRKGISLGKATVHQYMNVKGKRVSV